MFLLSNDFWKIKKSKKKGRGVFTKKDIAPGIVIGDYLGKVIRIQDEDTYDNGKHFYAMYYSDTALVSPDPRKNDIHLFNHSCTPNCWMYTYKGHTLYFSLRHIFPGEELTVSYLLSPLDKYCKPCTHLCDCGGVICFQTMHLSEKRYEKWEKFHDEESKRTKPEKVTIGQDLSMLSSYPKEIQDDPIYTLFGANEVEPLTIQEQAVPSITELRKMIRESGKTLQFSNLNLKIFGVLDNLLISEPT